MYFKKRISFLETSIVRNVDCDGSEAESQQLLPVNTMPFPLQEACGLEAKVLCGEESLASVCCSYLLIPREETCWASR